MMKNQNTNTNGIYIKANNQLHTPEDCAKYWGVPLSKARGVIVGNGDNR